MLHPVVRQAQILRAMELLSERFDASVVSVGSTKLRALKTVAPTDTTTARNAVINRKFALAVVHWDAGRFMEDAMICTDVEWTATGWELTLRSEVYDEVITIPNQYCIDIDEVLNHEMIVFSRRTKHTGGRYDGGGNSSW